MTKIPSLEMTLTSTPIVAHPTKLRGIWIVEPAAKLRAIYGMEEKDGLDPLRKLIKKSKRLYGKNKGRPRSV